MWAWKFLWGQGFFITNPIYLIVTGLFKLFISYWVNCGCLCFSRNWFMSCKFSNFLRVEWFVVYPYCHFHICTGFSNIVFFWYWLFVFFLFFPLTIFLEAFQLYPFKDSALYVIDFIYCLFIFNWFLPFVILYYFLSSVWFGFILLFFFCRCLKWELRLLFETFPLSQCIHLVLEISL